MSTIRIDLDGTGPRLYRLHPLPPAPAKDVGGLAVRDFWAAVTDVPCPVCPTGALRWAEAGYVPGYRVCDGCGRHYLAHGDADAPGVLAMRRRTRIARTATGKAIQALLRARGWRSLDLARELGASNSEVSGWLNGRSPSPARTAALRALGCDLPERRTLIDRLEADVAAHPADGPSERAARLGATPGAVRGVLARLRERGIAVPEHTRGRPPAPTDREPVAPMVARILERTGWSQAELARELDVSPKTLSAWVTGARYPEAGTLAALRGLAEMSS